MSTSTSLASSVGGAIAVDDGTAIFADDGIGGRGIDADDRGGGSDGRTRAASGDAVGIGGIELARGATVLTRTGGFTDAFCCVPAGARVRGSGSTVPAPLSVAVMRAPLFGGSENKSAPGSFTLGP